MYPKLVELGLLYVVMTVFAFDEIFVSSQSSLEMIEQGRTQYQLLRERGNLPQYGTCWKSAVETVDEGCRNLSEESQSDIALQLANCFLIMSGHEPYKCKEDKKPNLRAICISNMSDRAFNVYTEFYTHTQNICWFLRSQIWHETISENTYKVGKQLEVSAETQKDLLESQRESMKVQEKILQHGKVLEEVLESLYISTRAHQEILEIMTRSLTNFQSWVVGEMSWFDSIIFYFVQGIFVFVLTSIKRTLGARLPLFVLLILSLGAERLLTYMLISEESLLNTTLLYNDISVYIWYCRYFFLTVNFVFLIWHALSYQDLLMKNQQSLYRIELQNTQILELLRFIKSNIKFDKLEAINENGCISNGDGVSDQDYTKFDESRYSSVSPNSIYRSYSSKYALTEVQNGRYNLRKGSRRSTPDIA